MAKRKKRVASRKTKSKKLKTAKKSVKRVVGSKSRRTSKKISAKKSVNRRVGGKLQRTSKKVAAKAAKKQLSSRPKGPPNPLTTPVVEGEVIDVIDEPIPAVVRVTVIEETRITSPDSDASMSRDIPEPDSLGG